MGAPCSSVAHVGGMSLPARSASMILPSATAESAMSANGAPSPPGAAIEIGLLPITASAPPIAGMSGAVFAATIATMPASAIRALKAADRPK